MQGSRHNFVVMGRVEALVAPLIKRSGISHLQSNCRTRMAKVLWKYPIEELHGKLRTDFGAAQRKSKNGNGERDPFTVIYGKRDMTNHPLSSYEVEARARFAAIRAMVEEHRCNVQKRMADYAGFKAQSTYKTMNKYLWAICTAEYNASLEAGE